MSTSAYWYPDVDPEGERLSDDMKNILMTRFRDEDVIRLGFSNIGYLEGLIDVGSSLVKGDAETLIDAINKYYGVVIKIKHGE